jgi:F0F1-type ATP synthase assembly protein I
MTSARITAKATSRHHAGSVAADQGGRYGMAFRLASEFVAAVLVGAGLDVF